MYELSADIFWIMMSLKNAASKKKQLTPLLFFENFSKLPLFVNEKQSAVVMNQKTRPRRVFFPQETPWKTERPIEKESNKKVIWKKKRKTVLLKKGAL